MDYRMTEFGGSPVDIVGLYMQGRQHAAVFRQEKRSEHLLPHDPIIEPDFEVGRFADRFRRPTGVGHLVGSLSLEEAFNSRSGMVLRHPPGRLGSAHFQRFLSELIRYVPGEQEIHVLADNAPAHRTLRVDNFLAAHCAVHLQVYSSYRIWLTQVTHWLAQLARRHLLCPHCTTSLLTIDEKLVRKIRVYESCRRSFSWKYVGWAAPARRNRTTLVYPLH